VKSAQYFILSRRARGKSNFLDLRSFPGNRRAGFGHRNGAIAKCFTTKVVS
jgi:hypothetical protein